MPDIYTWANPATSPTNPSTNATPLPTHPNTCVLDAAEASNSAFPNTTTTNVLMEPAHATQQYVVRQTLPVWPTL